MILGYFQAFFLLCGHFWTNLNGILAPGLKLICQTTLFYKKNTFWPTVNDPPTSTPKQPKLAIFDKTDSLGLKSPPQVRVEPKTCSTVCGTPVPAILSHRNWTRLAGGAKKGQNIAHLGALIWLLGIFTVFRSPKSGEGDKMRSVSKNMRFCKKQIRPQFSKYRFGSQIYKWNRRFLFF